MPLYLWMSKEQANFQAGKYCRVQNSEASGTHQGYALGFDTVNDRVYQYTDATDRKDVPFREKDIVLAGVINDPDTFRVAVSWNGHVTPEGKSYCIDHGLDVCKDAICDAVANKEGFYTPEPLAARLPHQPSIATPAPAKRL